MTIEELIAEFEFLGDWESQCDYLIELGRELPALPTEQRVEANRVHGCQSNVWLVAEPKMNGECRLEIQANSDSLLVSGLIAILLALYSGRTPEEILSIDAEETFRRLGLNQHLSPQRRNGMSGMVKRIRTIAASQVESA